jgi:site-specific recombinase XerD
VLQPKLVIVDAAERYMEFLESEGRSASTLRSYRQSLELIQELLGSNDLCLLDKAALRQVKAALCHYQKADGRPLSTASKNHYLIVLRGLLRYLIQEEEQTVLAPDHVRLFRSMGRRGKVLDIEQLGRLLASPDVTTLIGLRDRAILELFFSTGMRLGELASLNRRDINLKTRELSIRGKRGKVRVVFVSLRATDVIKRYLTSRADHLAPLFVAHPGRLANSLPPGEKFRLSNSSIYKLVKRYARLAGIVSDPSPHVLRHTFATDLLRNGCDLRSVQEMLGHRNVSTTQIYTHVTHPELKRAHEKYHSFADKRAA